MKFSAQNRTKGFTFLEILLTIAIIGVLVVPFLITYGTSRRTQALRSSAEQLADSFRNAHVYAREATDQKSWGILRVDDTQYSLVSGSPDSYSSKTMYSLERDVFFVEDFEIWFGIGTGETDQFYTVVIEDKNGRQQEIEIYETGLIELNFR